MKQIIFALIFTFLGIAISCNLFSQEDNVFTVVEEMPVYGICDTGLSGKEVTECSIQNINSYVATNVKYPKEAKKKGVEGTVFVSFVINTLGNITDIEILKGIENGKLLEEEAVRVVKTMTDWKSGKQRGKAVNVKYVLPIRFKLK